MILSHKNKFIFIKNYKTAGSSIESLLVNNLGSNDTICTSDEYKGQNENGLFNIYELFGYYPIPVILKYIRYRMKYFPHMPAWLIKKRIGEEKFNSYFKFCVIRNPYDMLISAFHHENKNNEIKDLKNEFKTFIKSIKSNKLRHHLTFNFDRLLSKDKTKLLVDAIIDYDKLKIGLIQAFKTMGIKNEINKLEVHKKGNYLKNYFNYYDEETIEIIKKIYKDEINYFNYKIPVLISQPS